MYFLPREWGYMEYEGVLGRSEKKVTSYYRMCLIRVKADDIPNWSESWICLHIHILTVIAATGNIGAVRTCKGPAKDLQRT